MKKIIVYLLRNLAAAIFGDIAIIFLFEILTKKIKIMTKICAEQFFNAVEKNEIDVIKEFLELGIDINLQDDYGNTALILAAYSRDEKIVEMLLGVKGINVNLQDNSGKTARIWAVFRGYNNIVNMLS